MYTTKKSLSKFGQAVKEVEGIDEGISSGFSSGQGLSFEELRSQDTSQNNISVELLSSYVDKGERDKIEFENSEAKKEMARLVKEQAIKKDKVFSKVAEKNGIEKALSVMDNASKMKTLEEKDMFTAYSRNGKDFISSEGINFKKPLMAIGGFFAHLGNDLFSDTRIQTYYCDQTNPDIIKNMYEHTPELT